MLPLAPTVSVITLTYNHREYLSQCIESVRAQTFASWEQIIVDDGSNDGTHELIAGITDPRVRAVHQRHKGVRQLVATYRLALARCRGRLIAFLDGDDYWAPDALERLTQSFEDPDVVLVYGATELLAAGSPIMRVPTPEALEHWPSAVRRNRPTGQVTWALMSPPDALRLVTMVATMMRRAALDRIGGLQAIRGLPVMDHPTILRLALEGHFEFVDHTTTFKRLYERAVSQVESTRILLGVHRSVRSFRRRHRSRLPMSAEEWARIESRWLHFLSRRDLLRPAQQLLLDRRWEELSRYLFWLLCSIRLWPHLLSRLGRGMVKVGLRITGRQTRDPRSTTSPRTRSE